MRAQYIKIHSTDLDRIEQMRKWMKSEHPITLRKSVWKNGKDLYTLRIGSHIMYHSLCQFGLHPHKSLTIQLPFIPKAYVKDFVRGYFDGDGCVYISRRKDVRGQLRVHKISVIFTSGSHTFLEELALLLSTEYGLKTQNIIKAKTAFQIRYSTNDSITLFEKLYKGCKKGEYLERKHAIFRQWLEIRNGHVAKKLTRRSAKPLCVGANPTMASHENLLEHNRGSL